MINFEPLDQEHYEALKNFGILYYKIEASAWVPLREMPIQWPSVKRTKILRAGTEDDALFVGRKLNIRYQIEITNENFADEFGKGWVCGWDSEKVRVANPSHKIFMMFYSVDCDGMSGAHVESFATIFEAAEETDEFFRSAEGPANYYLITKEEYEEYESQPSVDRYAEAMGY